MKEKIYERFKSAKVDRMHVSAKIYNACEVEVGTGYNIFNR